MKRKGLLTENILEKLRRRGVEKRGEDSSGSPQMVPSFICGTQKEGAGCRWHMHPKQKRVPQTKKTRA